MSLTRKLLDPSTLVLLAANAIPLAGVLLWHWDVFLLLMLYWMETLIIGFWTILAIAVSPRAAMGRDAKNHSRAFLVPFFMVHSGIFMTVHFIFLWEMFSGDWARRVKDVPTFVIVIVIGAGLWLPLLALFISRGFSFLLNSFGARLLPRSLAFLHPQPAEGAAPAKNVLYGFYGRIATMHLVILAGGFLAQAVGALAPLVLLIVLKVAADLGFHFKYDLAEDNKTKPIVTTTT